MEELDKTHQEQQSSLTVDMKKELSAMQKILMDCVSICRHLKPVERLINKQLSHYSCQNHRDTITAPGDVCNCSKDELSAAAHAAREVQSSRLFHTVCVGGPVECGTSLAINR